MNSTPPFLDLCRESCYARSGPWPDLDLVDLDPLLAACCLLLDLDLDLDLGSSLDVSLIIFVFISGDTLIVVMWAYYALMGWSWHCRSDSIACPRPSASVPHTSLNNDKLCKCKHVASSLARTSTLNQAT